MYAVSLAFSLVDIFIERELDIPHDQGDHFHDNLIQCFEESFQRFALFTNPPEHNTKHNREYHQAEYVHSSFAAYLLSSGNGLRSSIDHICDGSIVMSSIVVHNRLGTLAKCVGVDCFVKALYLSWKWFVLCFFLEREKNRCNKTSIITSWLALTYCERKFIRTFENWIFPLSFPSQTHIYLLYKNFTENMKVFIDIDSCSWG